jgi:hypothetical protein
MAGGRWHQAVVLSITGDTLPKRGHGFLIRRAVTTGSDWGDGRCAPWSNFELIEPRVVELSPDSGIVVYRVNAQRAGEEPYEAIISSTFVRGDGRWLLAFHQQSPIAD